MADMYLHMTDAQQDAVLEALPDSRLAVAILNRRAEQATPAWARYVRQAIEDSKEGELEVDENAIVSFSPDKGAYVMSWVWLYADDADVTSKQQRFALSLQTKGNKKEMQMPVQGED